MTDADRSRFADTPGDASASLPPYCQEGFARLAKLIHARPGKFQLLVLDCRDQLLRDRLITALDEHLHAASRHTALLRLSPGSHPDFAAVERSLTALAHTSSVIHVTGGPSWFDTASWESFNIRREAVAHQVKASLLFWLDPESITALARIAIDLWAWRAAVITFAAAPQPLPAATPEPDIRIIDDRTLRERTKRIAYLRQATREPDLPDDIRLGLAVELGDLSASIGQIAEAEAAYRDAALAAADERSRAVTMGRIADILQARGQLDEALRIRQQEELPVYERLGDVRARAITMGQIADILQARGQLDEALRIRQQEVLPVFERLGDVRSRAVTMGKIADVLQARGQLDEALRIRQQEQLPVSERLGDVRERAVTMGKIADILHARGQLDEALRIRQQEQLPVFERLGDVRERAITMGKIADILQARGQLDEALRIRQQEELPVYERLGDVRERAITMGRIADILQDRGQLDEALRIRQQEELPVYERLGDVRSRAITLQKIAIALIDSGGLEHGRRQEIVDSLAEALTIARQMKLPEDVSSVGILLAQILASGNLREEAVGILNEAETAFATLGDPAGVQHVKQIRGALTK